MGGISPIQLFIIPFVFLFALPLAIFAGVTTVLAFLVLYLRLTIAYFDVGLETIRFLVLGNGAYNRQQLESLARASPSPPSSLGVSSPPPSPETSASRQQYRHYNRRKGRGSASSGSLTPVAIATGISGIPLVPSSAGFDRDFEGIGGWRIDGLNVRADDDEQWYHLNSRLELPDRRHHFRSRSGGAVLSGPNGAGLHTLSGARAGSVSPGALKMTASPNSSRSRTPTNSRPHGGFSKFDHEGYFPLQDRKHAKKLSA
ncbi:hypothetical protein MGN70_009784 [Eutypa lata]|nr:hypothetical protein MGN70_009784 [Eutypa lata]